jgi:hypothetical protein
MSIDGTYHSLTLLGKSSCNREPPDVLKDKPRHNFLAASGE